MESWQIEQRVWKYAVLDGSGSRRAIKDKENAAVPGCPELACKGSLFT